MAVEIAMQWNESYGESVYTFANTINTHEGGTHEEGFRAALTGVVNKYARGQEAAQGEGRQAHRRGHPRGPGRDHLGQAGQPAVRGPDQDQARQHRGEVASCRRPATTGWPTGSSATRPRPRRSSPRRPRRPGPGAPPSRRASWPGASALLESRLAAGQAGRLPVHRPAASPSSSSSRATRPAARPSQGRDPMYPGDPADPRQDHQRREGPDRPGAEEQRGPVADHRARHRHPRRLRPRPSCATTRSC